MLRYIVKLATLTDVQFRAGDVNADLKIDVTDVVLVLRKAVGLP